MTSIPLETPFIDSIDAACERFADSPCLVFGKQSYSYRQLQQQSRHIAAALQSSGLGERGHCAIYSENSAIAVLLMVGIVRAGGVWLPVNSRNTIESNVAALQRLDCDLLFFEPKFVEAARALQRVQPELRCICLEDEERSPSVCAAHKREAGTLYFREWLASEHSQYKPVKRDIQDTLALPMTGGTTGEPKGVMLSERNFRALSFSMCEQLARSDELIVYLCAMPLTHVGGRIVLSSLPSGAKFIIHRRFDPQLLLSTIENERVSDLFLPPTAIYSLPEQENIQSFDFTSLRALSYGAAPVAVTQLRKALRIFGPVMRGLYGQTECPMMISALTPEQHFEGYDMASEKRLSSVGKATSISQIAMLDEHGGELPLGRRGEIAVQGPMVSKGYYKNNEESAKMRCGAWHLTGDIGYLEEKGFLYIVDRRRDVIITGGFNVYSAEVELVISALAGVSEVAVIGLPCEKWGEQVTVFICAVRGGFMNQSEMLSRIQHKLGPVKTPKRIVFVESLPRTAIGKVDKRALRADYTVIRQSKQ